MLKLWKAAALTLALAVCFAAGWLLRPVWDRGLYKTIADIPDPFLASDDSGYLGVVKTECRDWNTKEPISYEIQQADGKIIKRSAKGIHIYTP